VVQLQRRATGAADVDEWGLDPELVSLANPILATRWDIEVTGAERLPAVGGALLVFNRRFGVSEPWVLARGVRQATGRFVRTVGVPDVAPIGPLLRRFGGVVDRTDEVAGLLRAGQLVGLPTARDLRTRERVGRLAVHRLEAAIETGCPVVPVALIGRELGRTWRVVVGEPVAPILDGGPLAAAELADAVHGEAQVLVDESLPTSWWL
jgi:1-acyl-sn-glycerol-3-phosphate acyltransferase